jgi:hypothetical protein
VIPAWLEILTALLSVGGMLGLTVGTGYWASRIMEEKGRSAGAGWGLGLLLSLAGVLIAAILMPDHEELRRRARREGIPAEIEELSDEELDKELRRARREGIPAEIKEMSDEELDEILEED